MVETRYKIGRTAKMTVGKVPEQVDFLRTLSHFADVLRTLPLRTSARVSLTNSLVNSYYCGRCGRLMVIYWNGRKYM